MHKLYLNLQRGLDGNKDEFLVDAVSTMLEKISTSDFISSMQLMFSKFSPKSNPGQMMVMFVSGLKKNNVFEFADRIKEIANGRSTRG